MIRFGIIGTNVITDRFLEASKSCPDFLLTAVYSRSMERAKEYAARQGAELTFDDLDAFAACEEIDAVYVASPNSCHAAQSILLMEHGKHVLCEKPVASNLKEFQTMKAASQKNGVVLLEAMRSVHAPGFTAIRENLPKLGTIRRVSFDFSKYSSRYDNFKKGIIENAFNPALSNSALMDIGVYCVHPLMALFGKPQKVLSHSLKLSNGMEGAGTIVAAYEGMQAELLYSKITDSRIPNQIQGEAAAMVIDSIANPQNITIYYRNGFAENLDIPQITNNMCYEISAFIGLIRDNRYDHVYLSYSEMEMELMDEVRRQQEIVFPADL